MSQQPTHDEAPQFFQANGAPILAMTPTQAATAAGRSRSRIYELIREGRIAARKDGVSTLVETSELSRWIKSLPRIEPQATAA